MTMRRLTSWKRLGLAALLGAAVLLGPSYAALAQDDSADDAPAAVTSAAPNVALVAAAPTAVPQISVLPALDNPAEPGDAFPTDRWGSTE
jgi:hypothetical protein